MTALLSQKQTPTHCDFCDTLLAPTPTTGPSGYGWYGENKAACYACCAWLAVFDMKDCKPGDCSQEAFYFTREPAHDDALGFGVDALGRVTIWPGTLEMRVYGLGTRQRVPFDRSPRAYCQRVYFSGPDDSRWSGTIYETTLGGDLLRNVRRLKG